MLPPRKPGIPSQQRSQRRPYYPTVQQDVAALAPIIQDHESGALGAPSAFVVSTYDARPINGVDFQTQSGSNAADTGFASDGVSAFSTASIFYDVPVGYQAVLRDYHILTIPAAGQTIAGPSNPIFLPNGASNVKLIISILVNGIYQPGMSGIVTWASPFGDIFGECYVLANEGDQIELRLDGSGEGSEFYQALMSMHGNLLLSRSSQLEYAPGTTGAIPVHDAINFNKV